MRKCLLCFFKGVCLIASLFFLQNAIAQDFSQTALSLVRSNAAKLGFSANDEQNIRISNAYMDRLSGALIVYVQQTYKGIDVDKSIKVFSFKNNLPITSSGRFTTISKIALTQISADKAISAFTAVNQAALHLQLPAPSMINNAEVKDPVTKETSFGNMGISNNNVTAKLIWVNGKGFATRLCWGVNINPVGKTDHWLIKVDAQSGEIIGKENYTVNCSWKKVKALPQPYFEEEMIVEPRQENYEVKLSGAGPLTVTSASYNAVPFPIEAPSFPGGTPAIQTDPWNLSPAGSDATTLKWNSDANTDYDSTRGNNVLARVEHGAADDNAINAGFGAHSTTALPNLTFNSIANFTVAPNKDSTFQRFSATNLFYWNNIMHDISYQYGFDEPSGNFQQSNLGRGGQGGDYVFAFAQYDNGQNGNIDNSNFATDVDGQNPVMHMFLFDYTSPDRDGDVDEGVVSHEYTHGISNRLTGGGTNAGCLQDAEQMGEGWSDYDALMITTNWATAAVTDGTKKRPIGTYVLGEAPTGAGIRNYPYSTDMSIDPWTYAMIGTTGGEPHNVGEIWTTVLWDMTWNIIQMDGINQNLFDANGTGGNSVALKLVYEGLKLQGCSPGFIDGRNGILKADTLLFGGKYSCAIWAAFAKRGMGINASEGSSDIIGDETFDFSLGNINMTKHVDKDSADQQEVLTYSFGVKGKSICGASIPTGLSIVDTLPSNLTYVNGGTYNSANRTVTFTTGALADGDSTTYTFTALVNNGSYFAPSVLLKDNAAGAITNSWTNSSTTSQKWATSSNLGISTYYSQDARTTSDKQLTTATTYVVPGMTTVFQFNSLIYNDGGVNGGVVEISSDNGSTWQDLGTHMSGKVYSGKITFPSAIKNREAFTGAFGTYYAPTYIDLSSFAGKTISIRFRYCTSSYTGGIETAGLTGWYVDSIKLYATPAALNTGQVFNASDSLQQSSAVITFIKNGSLPVTWGNFTAVKNGNTALLDWSTLQETNSSRYLIQRSNDGIHFENIGTVAAAGMASMTTKYNYTDGKPLNGNDYYRLQQFDRNGNFVYSEIRTLNFNLPRNVIISPNPAKDVLNVTIAGNEDALRLYLINSQGQTVQQYTMLSQELQITLPALSNGVYYLKIASPDGTVSTHKVVVNK